MWVFYFGISPNSACVADVSF